MCDGRSTPVRRQAITLVSVFRVLRRLLPDKWKSGFEAVIEKLSLAENVHECKMVFYLGCNAGLMLEDGLLWWTYDDCGRMQKSHSLDVTKSVPTMQEMYNNFLDLFTPLVGMDVVVLLDGKLHCTFVKTTGTSRFTCEINGAAVSTNITTYENHGETWWHKEWDHHGYAEESTMSNDSAIGEKIHASASEGVPDVSQLHAHKRARRGTPETSMGTQLTTASNSGEDPLEKSLVFGLDDALDAAVSALDERSALMKKCITKLIAHNDLNSTQAFNKFVEQMQEMNSDYDVLQAAVHEAQLLEGKIRTLLAKMHSLSTQ